MKTVYNTALTSTPDIKSGILQGIGDGVLGDFRCRWTYTITALSVTETTYKTDRFTIDDPVTGVLHDSLKTVQVLVTINPGPSQGGGGQVGGPGGGGR